MVKFERCFKNEIIEEWRDNYINITELKKITNRESLTTSDNLTEQIQKFDLFLENEIQKVNGFYNVIVDKLIKDIELIDSKTTLNLYQKSDSIRQYVLLNIIAVIKIVKRRNKRTPEIKNVNSFLKSQDFYECEKLKTLFKQLNELSKNTKINFTNDVIKRTSSISSFKTLTTIKKFCELEDYNYLPNYNLNTLTNDDIQIYLNKKLGINHLDEIITPSTKIYINDLEKKHEIPIRRKVIYGTSIIILLYLFLFGLDLMSNSFKVLSGKGMSILSTIKNPISGVMIGIIATVLLQSSSTSTSIVVTMVGANIVDVKNAIPIIMGANIGTSITNTLVSHAHIKNIDEFKKAFAGATVHDMFNFLSVVVILPMEIISQLSGYSILYNISSSLTNLFLGSEGATFKSPIKEIVSPISKLFLKVDKNVIKASAVGCLPCTQGNSTGSFCWDIKRKNCLTYSTWNSKYIDAQIIKSGFLKETGDTTGGIIGLTIALVTLCFALYYIVKFLHRLIIQSGGKGVILRLIQKSVSISPYFTMILGALLTISVQSSSITTSTFTPLVGLDILTVEQMFPLTLGANIGTTCTAILASLVTDSRNAIQIALCHLLFNIIGISIWFPIKFLRRIPVTMAIKLGSYVSKFRWFGVFYILYTFVLFPLVCWGLSYLFDFNIVGLISGIILIFLFMILSVNLFNNFDSLGNRIEKIMNIKKQNISSDIEMNIY